MKLSDRFLPGEPAPLISRKPDIRTPLFSRNAALLVACALFLCGALLGCLFAFRIKGESQQTLLAYLEGFVQGVNSQQTPWARIGKAFMNAFQFHLPVFLLGFTVIGVVGIPLLLAAKGFFLSFTLACFIFAYGKAGVWLAFGAFGVQNMILIPCLLYLAFDGFFASASLLSLAMGHVRKTSVNVFGSSYWIRFAFVALLLTAAVLYEAFAAPLLIRWIIGLLY